MIITTETATVYRGGGRRWMTLKGAVNAEAKAAYRSASNSKDRCGCDTIRWDGNEYNSPCEYHDQLSKVYIRYMRYAKHCITGAKK